MYFKGNLFFNKKLYMSVVKELVEKIEQQIKNTKLDSSMADKWEIQQVKDGVVFATGLNNTQFSELVEFENGMKGLVMDISEDIVWILPMGNANELKEGMIISTTGQVLSIWVGEGYLGRVVDGLANPIDGLGEIETVEMYPVERKATGVIERKPVHQPLETGIKSIDSMVPIGKWQRELIIWDRQTGKTSVAIDTILNQKGQNVKCIYVAIGQKDSKVRALVETLKEKGAMDYTVVVNASSSDSAIMQYLAPYVGVTIAEYFMFNNQDALIIYDDLSKHAVAYREVALLLRRPPGREAYPGDVFYLHSRLLERAAKLEEKYGGGSVTALPIIETQAGDVSAYIPTNVISITDGQIFLEADLFNSGVRPAINVGLSVSRVWGAAQTKVMKKVAGQLRLELATFRELAAFMQFASDLDPETQAKIEKGKRLVELLKQWVNSPIPFYKQVVTIYAGINDYLKDLPLEKISVFEKTVYEKMDTTWKELAEEIETEKNLTKEIEEKIKELINEVLNEVG